MSYEYQAGPGSFGLDSGGGGRRSVADLIMQSGRDQADSYNRSADIWRQGIGGITNALSGGLADYAKQEGDKKVQQAVQQATVPQRQAGPMPDGSSMPAKAPDINQILGALPGPLQERARKGIQDFQDYATKSQKAQLEISQLQQTMKEKQREAQQHAVDAVAVGAHHALTFSDQSDGGLSADALLFHQADAAGFDTSQYKPFLAGAMEDFQKAQGDPAAMVAFQQHYAAQRKPLLSKLSLGSDDMPASASVLDKFAPKGVVLGEGGTLVNDQTGAVMATGGPKQDTRGIEARLADATPGTPDYQKLLKEKFDLAQAGRDPDAAAARMEARKNTMDAKDRERYDKSYNLSTTQLDTLGKPLADQADKFAKLQAAVNQKTPQADALIAPELLSVMAGGSGSGLRMNEAEISRIIGGRSKLDSLQVALQKWDPREGKALSVTDEQRAEINKLVAVVHDRLASKVDSITETRNALLDAPDVEAHRKLLSDLKTKLGAVDSVSTLKPIPPGGAPVQVNSPDEARKLPRGTLFTTPDGRTMKVP